MPPTRRNGSWYDRTGQCAPGFGQRPDKGATRTHVWQNSGRIRHLLVAFIGRFML